MTTVMQRKLYKPPSCLGFRRHNQVSA